MGILEFHFHDAEFDFAPSMKTGGGEEAEESNEEEGAIDWEADYEEPGRGPGLGAFVALGVLVALAALVGLKRRSGGDGPLDEDEEVELEA